MATWRQNPGYADGTPDGTGRLLWETSANQPRGVAPAGLPLAVASGANGYLSGADKAKLDGIEAGASADQTAAEILTAYNSQVAVVPQAEAEAGTATTDRRWTAQRVGQAIAVLAQVVNDTSPQLSGFLDCQGNTIVNYIQPHVPGVTGTLNQNAHGGRPILITGNVTVPVSSGFICLIRNKSGATRTITPASGNLIHEGLAKASISLPHLRTVSVHADGGDIWVDGALS